MFSDSFFELKDGRQRLSATMPHATCHKPHATHHTLPAWIARTFLWRIAADVSSRQGSGTALAINVRHHRVSTTHTALVD
jgi:hypothetical protein